MEALKKDIADYVNGFLSDYHAEQSEGEYTGDVDSLAEDYGDFSKNKDTEKIEKAIKEMIQDSELEKDTVEWVNPENEQRTIYVNIITTSDHISKPSDFVSIRKNQRVWGNRHPENFVNYEKKDFNIFKKNLLEETNDNINNSDSSYTPTISIAEIRNWKNWEDVTGHDII